MLAPGYAFDVSAGGYVGLSFAVTAYPGLKALHDRDFEAYRRRSTTPAPTSRRTSRPAPAPWRPSLPRTSPTRTRSCDDSAKFFMPVPLQRVGAATPMTRDEFVAAQTVVAERLRTAVLEDATANAALVNLAADRDGWVDAYLGALEESGMLRPEGQAPPIRLTRRSRA